MLHLGLALLVEQFYYSFKLAKYTLVLLGPEGKQSKPLLLRMKRVKYSKFLHALSIPGTVTAEPISTSLTNFFPIKEAAIDSSKF